MWVSERLGLGAWRHWLAGGALGRTLEVGCGTGRNLPHYGTGARVVAIEPCREVLAAARRRGPRVPLAVASAEHLPFRSGAFDTVVSALVFCSVRDPHRGLREVRRVLRPLGTLRMMEHVRSRHPLGARFQDTAQPAWTWLTGGCRPNRETEANVTAAGFVIDQDSRVAEGVMRRFVARPAGQG
jgi:SAM-dependent methyltransferase